MPDALDDSAAAAPGPADGSQAGVPLVGVSQADVQATWCEHLVEAWVWRGLRVAMIAPGSRSTPLALALADDPRVRVEVFVDERSAAFAALGASLGGSCSALALCTSGTAATHFHAAVVEASLAGVPLLVVTADRPPELHGVGAPQTIDQQALFGSFGRFVDFGVPEWASRHDWSTMAQSAWPTDGPVHVNLPFREPLLGEVLAVVGDAHETRSDHAATAPSGINAAAISTHRLSELTAVLVGDLAHHSRGVIVAGRGVDDPSAVHALAATLGWPIFADPRSGCRCVGEAVVVSAFDGLLRHELLSSQLAPSCVLHLGEPPASKVLAQWVSAAQARHVQVLSRQVVIDPQRMMHRSVVAPIGALCRATAAALTAAGARPSEARVSWASAWGNAQRLGDEAIDDHLMHEPLTEPAVARQLTRRPIRLVASSSMPIRDVEWFGAAHQSAAVFANRGANGIDGVLATAIGVATVHADATTVALIGDVALLHDSSSLVGLARRNINLCVVVIDNDGGGIFSFLPQATELAADRFEQLFGTPHGADLVALATAHGLSSRVAATSEDLDAALAGAGVRLVVVPSHRATNRLVHTELGEAIGRAVDVIDIGSASV
jgi:2-succinyl-5-enolpyruvyl-6-hydroxy-3-cyclohexene-1-carboxylate synthase